MLEKITSKENKKIKDAAMLKDGKSDRFLVEGYHLVEMALEANLAEAVFTTKEISCGVPQYLVTDAIIKKLASSVTPEGIVAVVRKKEPEAIKSRNVLFLDRVQDPGNVGTLLRTALAFGFKDILLTSGCAKIYSSKVIMSSQGAIFKLNIREEVSEKDLEDLKKKGYRIIGTSLKGVDAPDVFKKSDKQCLVLGNEGKGVSPDILSVCDSQVRIEMEDIDSLNVGVAGGILMYLAR